MQLSFAVVPLVWFTSERRKMRDFVNGSVLRAVAWTVAFVIMGLNGWLLVGAVKEWVA
jgi:manganese transport protein